MNVFVSSVRVGLEQERDSLRGLLLALGHEPVMFEDFTALPVPPRQACMDAVRRSDAYLLLLGERYGHVFPETDLSPTAEEHVAARTAGVPRLAMRKAGVAPEPRQQALIDEVGSYQDGLFYEEFTDAVDLQAKVAAALRLLAASPGTLTYTPLPAPPAVDWRWDWPREQQGRADHTVLELHVQPTDPRPVPSRVLRSLPDRLAAELRSAGGAGPSPSVPATHDGAAAWAHVVQDRSGRGYGEVRDGTLLGLRVAATGQTSVWGTLPGDGMGALLDPADLTDRLASYLRLAGAATPGDDAQHLALAVGLSPLSSVSEGRVTGLPRHQATLTSGGRGRLAVPADEAVSRPALSHGARDAARDLAEAVLTDFQDGGRGRR